LQIDDRSLSAHCSAVGTCASQLLFNGLINPANALTLEKGTGTQVVRAEKVIDAFAIAYRRALGRSASRDGGEASDLEGWLGLARADVVRTCCCCANLVPGLRIMME
jgi:hypothetical protein